MLMAIVLSPFLYCCSYSIFWRIFGLRWVERGNREMIWVRTEADYNILGHSQV
jgi:hypothetical protein